MPAKKMPRPFFILPFLLAFLIFSAIHAAPVAFAGDAGSGFKKMEPGKIHIAPWSEGPRFIVLPKGKTPENFNVGPEKLAGDWLAYADLKAVARDAGIEDRDEQAIWEKVGVFLKASGFKRRYLDRSNFVNLHIDAGARTIEFRQAEGSQRRPPEKAEFTIEYTSYEYMEIKINGEFRSIVQYDEDTLVFGSDDEWLVLRRAGSRMGVVAEAKPAWLTRGLWGYDGELSELISDLDFPAELSDEQLEALLKSQDLSQARSFIGVDEDEDEEFLLLRFEIEDKTLLAVDKDGDILDDIEFEALSQYLNTFYCLVDGEAYRLTFLGPEVLIISDEEPEAALRLKTVKNY